MEGQSASYIQKEIYLTNLLEFLRMLNKWMEAIQLRFYTLTFKKLLIKSLTKALDDAVLTWAGTGRLAGQYPAHVQG